jgi:hypothetical protein
MTGLCRQNAYAPPLLVNNNRTGSRISSEKSPLERHAPSEHDHVTSGRRGMQRVCSACGTGVNYIEWADRRFEPE